MSESAGASLLAPTSQARWAEVAVARPVPGPLTYRVPALLADSLQIGHVVAVPLGRTIETGYVVGLPSEPGYDPAKVRPIRKLVDPLPAFDARQLEFFRWIASYYLAPLGAVIRTAVPSEVRVKSVRGLEPTEDGLEALTHARVEGEEGVLLREVVQRPGLTKRGCRAACPTSSTPRPSPPGRATRARGVGGLGRARDPRA